MKNKCWRVIVERMLDDYERGVIKEKLNSVHLAKTVGVCRQTLWRDPRIKKRILEIRGRDQSEGGVSISRRTKEMRVRELEERVHQLESENALLVQNLLIICKRLREGGLDPREFVYETPEDVWVAAKGFEKSSYAR